MTWNVFYRELQPNPLNETVNGPDDSRATDWTVVANPGKCCQTETKLNATLQNKSPQTPEVQDATSDSEPAM